MVNSVHQMGHLVYNFIRKINVFSSLHFNFKSTDVVRLQGSRCAESVHVLKYLTRVSA